MIKRKKNKNIFQVKLSIVWKLKQNMTKKLMRIEKETTLKKTMFFSFSNFFLNKCKFDLLYIIFKVQIVLNNQFIRNIL